jgi:hypothetical protein
MPTKITGSRDSISINEKLMNRHPLVTGTPAEINQYIEDEVTDLASAKRVLKVLARGLAIALKK